MIPFLVVVALAIGAGLTIQAGVNASLRSVLGHPIHATVLNFVTGLILVLLFAVVARVPAPAAADLKRAPVWMYLGGLIGATYVGASVVLAPRLGATLMVGLLVTGQLAAALVIDHFGVLGFPEHRASLWRVAGVACLVLGVIIVRRS